MLNFVYLTPRIQYLTKMSRVRFHQIEAIAKKSNLIWSGPGWDNYDDSKSVNYNLNKLCQRIDLLIVFDHRPLIDFDKVIIPKCIMMNEMHDPNGSRVNAFNLILNQGYNMVVCHHKNEMLNSFFKPISDRFYNIPHSSNASIFRDYKLEKKYDVMVCGNIKFAKYSLRKRYPAIVDCLKKLGYNAVIHSHPGGFHQDSHTNKYLIDFAKSINQSKICMTCSSIYKCAFGKYSEIPMCRSLLAGDLPDERQDFFSKFMLVINNSDSDSKIVNKIIEQLENKDDLRKKTDFGYFNSHKEYTMEKYADKFIDAVEKFLRKKKIFI